MSFKYDVLGKVRFGNELEDILKLKGIKDIDSFLNPTIKNTESELLFDNIEKARDLFIKHISNKDVIDLLVDCDVDGFTSASNIYQYIKRLSPDIEVRCFIHKGKTHGLSEFVDSMCEDDSNLVIVPDAGSGNFKECEKLITHGKDVIILDHHSIDASDNPAIVVNNQLSDRITDKAMTGVGITYKFTKLLDKYYGVNYADDYLDLVALGMIGDRADTFNLQTRYLILKGLEQIQNKVNKNKLISVLVDAQMYSMNNKITINGIGFYVCPLMNSMIRLGEYEDKCYMFEALCNSDRMLDRKVRGKGVVNMTIQEYVLKACQSSNRKQKKITEESAAVLSEEIKKFNMDKLPILVCNARDDVDSNSTGLIANRLADQYRRPCLLMRRVGDICKGSGRGSDKCEILNFNQWCKDTELFNKVKGHPEAFGCEITYENTNKLLYLLSTMRKIDEPTYHVYNVYEADKIYDQIIKNVAKWDCIWGNSVSEPIFLIKSVPCNKYNLYLLGSKQNKIEFTYHNIKFVKQTKGSSLASLYKEIVSIGENVEFDIIGRFSIDYKSGKTAQVLIEDWMFYKSDKAQGFFG
uniref:Single-stranded-DNA-specific exonuclease RecJ n=1 Tax=virus sp. ctmTa7 TaxID=2828255 RepID=A0A8S5RB64_9VIRU|nr:MAG TPA: single-stranded-DNA-specific exonuclease RecJ [virus sp. ctmTa7]